MSAGRIMHTTHGIDLIEKPDGGVFCWRGSQYIGGTWASPALQGQVAYRDGESMPREVPSRHAGIAYVVGGCPDCVCDQTLCRTDDTGRHCEVANCGYCLNGCSADDPCPMGVTQ